MNALYVSRPTRQDRKENVPEGRFCKLLVFTRRTRFGICQFAQMTSKGLPDLDSVHKNSADSLLQLTLQSYFQLVSIQDAAQTKLWSDAWQPT